MSEEKKELRMSFNLDKDTLITAILVILVVVSGWQTVKLGSLSSNGVSAKVAPAATSSGGSGSAALPASLESLPSQVGGC